MRQELLKELHETLSQQYITIDYREVIFEPYEEDDFYEESDPQIIFNKDGVTATIAWELGEIYIGGLTPQEINYLKTGGDINIYDLISALEKRKNSIYKDMEDMFDTQDYLDGRLDSWVNAFDIAIAMVKEYSSLF